MVKYVWYSIAKVILIRILNNEKHVLKKIKGWKIFITFSLAIRLLSKKLQHCKSPSNDG